MQYLRTACQGNANKGQSTANDVPSAERQGALGVAVSANEAQACAPAACLNRDAECARPNCCLVHKLAPI